MLVMYPIVAETVVVMGGGLEGYGVARNREGGLPLGFVVEVVVRSCKVEGKEGALIETYLEIIVGGER